MSYDLDPSNLNQANRNGNGAISQGDVLQYGNIALDGASSSSSSNFSGEDYTTVNAGFGAGNNFSTLFKKIDVNGDGFIDQREFNQWGNEVGIGGSGSGAVNGSSGGTTYSADCTLPNYLLDARGYFRDPNPLLENRANPDPARSYTQNIRIRFLQPPPLGPLPPEVITQVRPPHQQQPPRLISGPRPPQPQKPPPRIIRERPPVPPPVGPPVIRTEFLPPLRLPQTLIYEQYAAPPAPPQDIDLIRWLPYGTQRRPPPIIKRAPCVFPVLHNRIIKYGPVQVRVVRQFQRFGVTPADPVAYAQQYGPELLDSATFVQQARAAGVIEDISVPAYGASLQNSFSDFQAGVVPGDSLSGVAAGSGAAGTFRNADFNNDGVLSPSEFSSVVQQGL